MSDVFLKLHILWLWMIADFEHWRDDVWKKDLDQAYCCSGRECGCGGMSIRDVYLPNKVID